MSVKIKICGLRRLEDVDAVNALLPEYAGFVFAPSKRRVSASQAAALRKRLSKDIAAVGVFVDEHVEEIARLCDDKILDAVQLHGNEDEATIARLKRLVDVPVIKALAVVDHLPKAPMNADFVLYDAAGVQRGGNGIAFDWSLLTQSRTPYFLAGGLSPENVADALRAATPYGVDVSSGVETEGWKDADKMARFVQAVRAIGKDRENT
jgi:phosphoribosylanthranilate isomerase